MTLVLNQEQGQALSMCAEPVTIIDPKTNESYVLVRSAVYERMRLLLDLEDSSLTGRELSILVDRAMSKYDENDPALHLYQDD